MRKTKIICTLGPSTDDPSILRQLMLSGMDVARINMSHQAHDAHRKRIAQVRELREELGVGVVALDELFRITHETEHAVIRLRFIRTVLPEGEAVTPLEGQSFGWFDLKEPMPPDLLAPDRPVWEFLAE